MIDGVEVRCLLDTGDQVSPMTESFFKQHFVNKSLMDVESCLRVYAANGQDIPFVGYIETDLKLFGRIFEGMGFLVARDVIGNMARRKQDVPVVIGSNILRTVKDSCVDIPKPKQWEVILALYEEISVSKLERDKTVCTVKVAGRRPVLIPAQSITTITCSARPAEDVSFTGLVEPIPYQVVYVLDRLW